MGSEVQVQGSEAAVIDRGDGGVESAKPDKP